MGIRLLKRDTYLGTLHGDTFVSCIAPPLYGIGCVGSNPTSPTIFPGTYGDGPVRHVVSSDGTARVVARNCDCDSQRQGKSGDDLKRPLFVCVLCATNSC